MLKSNSIVKSTGVSDSHDLETSKTFSLNGQLDKIKYISSAAVETVIESDLLTKIYDVTILNKDLETIISLTDPSDISINCTELCIEW